MRQILLYMVMIVYFAGCSFQADRDGGGTSIEVVSIIKGQVKRSDSTVVENAKVSIIALHSAGDANLTVDRDSTFSDAAGQFCKKLSRTGALGVEIKDTSGNGAFKACTLMTTDTLVDLGTVVLEELADGIVTVVAEDGAKAGMFYVWCREIGTLFDADSQGVFTLDSIPAGTYHIRVSPKWLSKIGTYEIVDTTVVVAPGDSFSLEVPVPLVRLENMAQSLKEDLAVIRDLYEDNGYIIKEDSIPNGIGFMNDRVSFLILSDEMKILPDYVDKLDKLEWLMFFVSNGHAVTELPESIGNLQNLTRLTIGSCPKLTSLPSSIANLKQLEIFEYYSGGGLTSLPEFLYEMNWLSHVTFEFTWVPTEREQEWALHNLHNGDEDSLAVWLADLEEKYGDK